jgi:hypothetical protein
MGVLEGQMVWIIGSGVVLVTVALLWLRPWIDDYARDNELIGD